jgi:pimeloyl-ACP methyl ester carboxylesterase
MLATKNIEVIPHFQLETLPPPKPAPPFYLKLIRLGFGIPGRVFPAAAAQLAFRLFSTPRIRAQHKTSDAILESARVFEVLYGRQILKGYEWGSGPKTVLLVHGWESRGTALRSFVPGLVSLNYRVVAFDGPAHGNSGGKRTSLPDFAGAVKAVINQVGSVESIITHSFGGPASVYALAHPDPSISVKKLVLIGVPSSTQQVVRDFIRMVRLSPRAAGKFKVLLRRAVSNQPFEEADILHNLGLVKTDGILVVHDRDDLSVPFESAEAIVEKYPAAKLLVTYGYGHYSLMKQEEVIDRVVDFVAAR